MKRTFWFAGYKAAVKAQMRLSCQGFDGIVEVICLHGGIVTQVEQEEMSTIIRDAEADAKMSVFSLSVAHHPSGVLSL